MARCDNCLANKVCDHHRFGFENCGSYISAADVAPKSEVDRLTMECFVLEQECGKFKADIKELKTEVVREIIKMIDKKIAIAGSSLGIGGRRTGKTLNVGKIIGLELIKADIKEKYLEGKYE